MYTERAGHAVEIAAQKLPKRNAHVVVAIGGDGTINEIARSLVHTKTALGIIPCGSGNGLARHLHIPMEPKKALDSASTKDCIDVIDYGKINDAPFFCTCGVGFDAFVSLKFAQGGKERATDLSGEDSAGKSEVSAGNVRTGNGRRHSASIRLS